TSPWRSGVHGAAPRAELGPAPRACQGRSRPCGENRRRPRLRVHGTHPLASGRPTRRCRARGRVPWGGRRRGPAGLELATSHGPPGGGRAPPRPGPGPWRGKARDLRLHSDPAPMARREELTMPPEEYDRHDGLGLADLVRRREVTPAELLDAA